MDKEETDMHDAQQFHRATHAKHADRKFEERMKQFEDFTTDNLMEQVGEFSDKVKAKTGLTLVQGLLVFLAIDVAIWGILKFLV